MPFQSEAQRRYLYKFHPDVAKRWEDKYGTPKRLPYHVKRKRKHRGGSLSQQLRG